MTRVVFGGKPASREEWRAAILELSPTLDLVMDPASCDPATVDILLYEPSGPVSDLAPYAGAAAVQSLWAGVETIITNPTLPDNVPLLRMVEDGLRLGMTEYVTGHVLRIHLQMEQQRKWQAAREWGRENPPLAKDRRVGIIGLGALGSDAAEKLTMLGFDVAGWSRSAKSLPGVRCLNGADGLDELLRRSEIVVLLAPQTAETIGLLNAERIAMMPRGSHIINAARGPLIDDAALLAALDTGQIASAVLDVFDTEPLPQSHPYWGHPSVTVTPHVASATRAETAAVTIVEQVRRFETGEPFQNIVDRQSGY